MRSGTCQRCPEQTVLLSTLYVRTPKSWSIRGRVDVAHHIDGRCVHFTFDARKLVWQHGYVGIKTRCTQHHSLKHLDLTI